MTFGLVLIVAALAGRVVANRCQLRMVSSFDLASGVAILSTVLTIAVISCFGDALLDIARCDIRGWIASTALASLCLALAASVVDHRQFRFAVGFGTIAFAAFVLAAFPSKEHAFRGGLSSLTSQISITTGGLPLMIGVTFVVFACCRAPASRRIFAAAGGLVLVATAILLSRAVVTFPADGFADVTYVPQLSGWLAPLCAAFVLGLCFRAGFRGRSPRILFGLVAIAAVSIVLTIALGIEFLATRLPYLAYQIGAPRIEPQPGGWLPAAAAAVLVLDALRILRRMDRKRAVPTTRTSEMLALMALLLAITFFIRVNYMHPRDEMARAIVSLDRYSGGVNWTLRGLEGPQLPIDGRNSPATPTPVTDGRVVCAYFGTPGLMCADARGRRIWSRTDLGYEGFYGVGFSPLLAGALLIISSEVANGLSFVHVLEASTGVTRWKRDFRVTSAISGNNRTPLVANVAGKAVIILWGLNSVKAMALDSGADLWSYRVAMGSDLVSSLTADDERLYLSDTTGTVALDYASLSAGREPVLWTNRARSNCVSPVLSNGMLFTITDSGLATALQAETGQTVWRQRLAGQYFASPVASPDAVYFTNSDGLTSVVSTSAPFHLIAQNDLSEPIVASAAATRGQLFFRTATRIYAIVAADRRLSATLPEWFPSEPAIRTNSRR